MSELLLTMLPTRATRCFMWPLWGSWQYNKQLELPQTDNAHYQYQTNNVYDVYDQRDKAYEK